MNVQDRFAIQDLLMKYAWAIDTGDVEAMAGLFAPDGAVRMPNGDRHETRERVRQFYRDFFSRKQSGGGMHFLQHLHMKRAGDGYVARSYWLVFDAAVQGARSKGYSDDTCIKVNGEWKIKERYLAQ